MQTCDRGQQETGKLGRRTRDRQVTEKSKSKADDGERKMHASDREERDTHKSIRRANYRQAMGKSKKQARNGEEEETSV